jgi:hypothetical protein
LCLGICSSQLAPGPEVGFILLVLASFVCPGRYKRQQGPHGCMGYFCSSFSCCEAASSAALSATSRLGTG